MVLNRGWPVVVGVAAAAVLPACGQLTGLDDWQIAESHDASVATDAPSDDAPATDSTAQDSVAEDSLAKDAAAEDVISPWEGGQEAADTAAEADGNGAVCEAGSAECDGLVPRTCDAAGQWQSGAACAFLCTAGACTGVCKPGAKDCQGTVPRSCDATGHWQSGTACPFVCSAGACTGVCKPGATQCSGNLLQTCSSSGQWNAGTACSASKPACSAGQCVTPSCVGLPSNCGKSGDQSCCAAPVVPGGTFKRSYDGVNNTDGSYPATISSFKLDRYEVTVGRFRKFVTAYPGSKPAPGAGKNPNNPSDTGWSSSFSGLLPTDQAALKAALKCESTFQTWTDSPGSNENRAINCLTWYMSYAFCIWDGGRLPTEAEWNYAAAGGSEQRVYPWSKPPTSTSLDSSYAVYGCTLDGNGSSCSAADIPVVGLRSPVGDGRWDHADLAGGMWEWLQDYWVQTYSINPCNDCANLTPAQGRVVRGGAFDTDPSYGGLLNVTHKNFDVPTYPSDTHGVRCARAL
jgi:formylglycine-generating enzyme required for sulfatase activity